MTRIFLALVALLVLAARPGAAQTVSAFEDTDFSVQIMEPWPTSVSKGFQPIYVDITNDREAAEAVRVRIRDGYGGKELVIERTIVAPPGTRSRTPFMIPADFPVAAQYFVEVRVGTDEGSSPTLGEPAKSMTCHNVLVAGEVARSSAETEAWAESLSPATGRTKVVAPGGYTKRYRNHGFYDDSLWDVNASVDVASVAYADMPVDWRAYTSLDFLVLDVSRGLPSDGVLRAILAWVRQGGEVLFVGQDVNQRLTAAPVVEPYMQARFALEIAGAKGSEQAYQCGVGRLFVFPTPAVLGDARVVQLVERELRQKVRTEFTPSARGSRMGAESMAPFIPGVGALPYRTFIVFMILFTVLIWPLNYMFIKKRGKPILLLVTVPAVAFGASLIAVLYGLVGQGVATRVSSDSIAVLDQRSGEVSVAEARATFSGWAPGRGLVPLPGTLVTSLEMRAHWRREGRLHQILIGQGEERFTAAYLPSRVLVRQAIQSDRTSRLRLDVSPDGAVTNGLDTEVEALVVHGFDGRWYSTSEPLASGESLQLEVASERPDVLAGFAFDASDGNPLPRGTYAARLAEGVFTDAGGLDLDELEGRHRLLGILEEVR